MDIEGITSLAVACGSAAATLWLWRSRAAEQAARLDAAWIDRLHCEVRRMPDGLPAWLGVKCRVALANLSTLPNVLRAAKAEIKLKSGMWLNVKPARGYELGGPPPLPMELPALLAVELPIWVWAEVHQPPDENTTMPQRLRQVLAWPPTIRLTLDALEEKRFVIECPLAEEIGE